MNMSPSEGLQVKLTLSDMIDAAKEGNRFDILMAELCNRAQTRNTEEMDKIIFKRLDDLGDFFDVESAKIGHALSADELKHIIVRGVDLIEQEVVDGKNTLIS